MLVLTFIFVLLFFLVLWNRDRKQKNHVILYNYPIVGRLRYFLERMRPFVRQYFLERDDEGVLERRKCEEVYRNSKGVDNKISFGSTQKMEPGKIIFHNAIVPKKTIDVSSRSLIIGGHVGEPFVVSKVFHVSGMSYGALSGPAVESLSRGASLSGCWQNTGEGGVSDYHLKGGANLIYQIGTANYGVRNEKGQFCENRLKKISDIENIKAFEIKLSQGAKPGLGGILPGPKISKEIALVRGIERGITSYSPPHNSEINDVSDIPVFISKVRNLSNKPVGIKLALSSISSLEDLLDECQKLTELSDFSYPDFITIDGGDGGTGSAPVAFMESVALPLKYILPKVVNEISKRGLSEKIKIIASGKLITSVDVAWALAVGADFVVSARGPMLSMGCIRAYECASNRCPSGIATHDKGRLKGFDVSNKSKRVFNYMSSIEKELYQLAGACGVEHPWDLTREHASMILEKNKFVSLKDLYK